MWVEFVIGSRLASRAFLWVSSPVFLPPQKPTSSNLNSTRIEDLHEHQVRLTWLPLYFFYVEEHLRLYKKEKEDSGGKRHLPLVPFKALSDGQFIIKKTFIK